MFETWLIVCNLYIATSCLELHDEIKHFKKKACIVRATEMQVEVLKYGYKVTAYKCVKIAEAI